MRSHAASPAAELRLWLLVALRALGHAAPDAGEPVLSPASHLAAHHHGAASGHAGARAVGRTLARIRAERALLAAGACPKGALQAALLLTMHILLIHQAFAGPDDPGGTRHYEL